MPFEQYVKYVGSQGYNLNTLNTEMRFDPDSDTAKLFFKPLKFLSKEQWEVAKRQGETPAAKRAIEFVFTKSDKPAQLAAPKARPEAELVEAAIEEPKKRPEKKAVEPAAKKDLGSIMDNWSKE
jgi:hypothetical protein